MGSYLGLGDWGFGFGRVELASGLLGCGYEGVALDNVSLLTFADSVATIQLIKAKRN